VLQVLQARRGLLYGDRCADVLAAVSGGSYTAAAVTLNGHLRGQDPARYADRDPLANGSPEEAHVLEHAEYVKRRWATFVLPSLLNLVALIGLFVWTGAMLADFAAVTEAAVGTVDVVDAVPAPVLAIVALGLLGAIVHSRYNGGTLQRYLALVLLPALALVTSPVLAEAQSVDVLTDLSDGMLSWLAVLIFLLVTAGIATLAAKAGIRGLPARALNLAPGLLSRLLGALILGSVATWWYERMRPIFDSNADADLGTFAAFMGVLFVAVPLSAVSNRASMHAAYRDALMSCFSVVRAEDGVACEPIGPTALSSMAPDGHPRLLITATANVRARAESGRRRVGFVSYWMSHDRCGVPGYDQWLPTRKLELLRVPSSLFASGWTAMRLTLFDAVASTGAALSPSMGRLTVPSARPLLAALNIRLGAWLPNVFNAQACRRVRERDAPGHDRGVFLGPGYDELVPEMFGLDGLWLYVSDGGHFDNLGLLSLLRLRCREIVCVDASPDRAGRAAELRRVVALADELEVVVDIDADRFARGSSGFYGATHCVGHVKYPDGTSGKLTVVKLGLTTDSANALKDRVHSDRGFPHHPTWRQWYREDRMGAYRDAGAEAAGRWLEDIKED